MLALIKNNAIVSLHSEGGWCTLPDGNRFSPADDGWADSDGFMLVEVQSPDPVPVGKYPISTDVELIEGVPKYVHTLEDIPVERASVPKSVVQQRIIEAGKMSDAYATLTANPIFFARWFAPDHPFVYCDDPDAMALVASLELDPAVILAPEEEV